MKGVKKKMNTDISALLSSSWRRFHSISGENVMCKSRISVQTEIMRLVR